LAERITRAAEVPMPTDHSAFVGAHAASTVARRHHHLDRIIDVFAGVAQGRRQIMQTERVGPLSTSP
jgi:hypothetical protein